MKRVKLSISMQPIPISGAIVELENVLKLSGAVLSGGEAKVAIQSGAVKLNGEVCTQRGKKCRPGDRIVFNGRWYEVVSA